jgi:hypothetical protein
MPQEAEPFFTYHVEHIIARRARESPWNACNTNWACLLRNVLIVRNKRIFLKIDIASLHAIQ